MSVRTRFGIVVAALEVQFWFPVWLLFLLDRGITTEQAAMADGLFRLVATACEVPVGWISDRIGRKKSLYFALAGTTITFLLIAAVTGPVSLVIAWATWGVLWALVSGLLTAYGWELGTHMGRGGVSQGAEFIRVRRICAAVAMVFSLLTAGVLYELMPTLPFLITAFLAVLVFPIAISLPPISRVKQGHQASRPLASLRTRGPMRFALVAGAVVLVAGWSIQMVFQPLGLEAKMTPSAIAVIFTGFAVAQLLGAWTVGRIAWDRTRILCGSVLGIAVCCAGVWVGFFSGAPLWMPLVLVIAIGFFYSIGTAYCDIWVSELSDERNRATMLSVVSLLGGAVMVATRPLLGVIAGADSASAAFGVWGVVCAALAGALLLILRRAARPVGS